MEGDYTLQLKTAFILFKDRLQATAKECFARRDIPSILKARTYG